MLRREQKIRNIILFTLFSLVFIGVGYAVISSNLTFNGSMRLNKITWDVHFENFEELYDNTVTATKTLSNNNTTLTYNVNLKKPGDIFEFTIDVVNNGNIDAMLSNIGKNGLTSAQQQVMDYNVTYLDGTTPKVKDSLKIGEVETFVISVKTKANITNAQLNATDTNLSLTFNPTYAQDDKTSTARNETLSTKIIAINGGKTAIKAKGEPARKVAETGVVGMYSLPDDYEDSFFYRGKVTDNYVIFNNICWKIIRINGNGTTRIIYYGAPADGKCTTDGTIGATKYNDDGYDNTFLGYMHNNKGQTTYEDTHKNVYDSDLKLFIDEWYKNNLISVGKKISDTLFCNDRTVVTTSGTGIGNESTETYYPRTRYDNIGPSLTCTNKNDSFTVNDSVIGNSKLKYPIATINGDEIMLAGYRFGSENANTEGYLYSSYIYWTMSPIAYYPETDGGSVWAVANGAINFGHVNINYYAKPVINLKQGIKIASGDGTADNPYVIN